MRFILYTINIADEDNIAIILESDTSWTELYVVQTIISNNIYDDVVVTASSAWWPILPLTYQEQWLCNEPDITVWSYTIAACNLWATTASSDWTISGWEHFQLWRNKWFDYWSVIQQATQIPNASYNPNNDTYWFVWNSNLSSYGYDWIENQDDNLWWYTDYVNWWSTDKSLLQWPCPVWYHVPTEPEWVWIVAEWDWTLWDISWTITEWTELQTALKMPLAGYRHRSIGLYAQSFRGFYWSASPNGTYWYAMSFYSSLIDPSNGNYRAHGFSVRCFKN